MSGGNSSSSLSTAGASQNRSVDNQYISVSGPQNLDLDECDACPHCADTCDRAESCTSCQKKMKAANDRRCCGPEAGGWLNALAALSKVAQDNERTITRCELRRHNHANSAWILVGDTIYDATPYIKSHPGGAQIILKKSGGSVDCTDDLRFHSKRAQNEWRKFKVGKLTTCSCPRDR